MWMCCCKRKEVVNEKENKVKVTTETQDIKGFEKGKDIEDIAMKELSLQSTQAVHTVNNNDQNQDDINNNERPRTMSLNSFYSVKSWKSSTTGDPDFYSIYSAESYKST